MVWRLAKAARVVVTDTNADVIKKTVAVESDILTADIIKRSSRDREERRQDRRCRQPAGTGCQAEGAARCLAHDPAASPIR